MGKLFSFIVGFGLVGLGAIALLFNLLAAAVGFDLWPGLIGRLWPVIIVAAGWVMVLLPALVRGWRGLGGLFIPGVPVLTTGGILLLASLTDWWGIWEWLWPLEVLGLAIGFLLAAIYMRAVWLTLPAILIGLNGVVLQFCAVTGWWEMWSVLWTIEPLALGLGLLAISLKNRSKGLFIAGLIMCGLAASGFLLMTGILSATIAWPWLGVVELVAPVGLILIGGLLIGWSVRRRPSASY